MFIGLDPRYEVCGKWQHSTMFSILDSWPSCSGSFPQNNSVEIYNAIGQVVYTQLNISDRTVSVDINSLPKGLYIVRYTDNNGIVNRNFIKN